MHHPLPPPTPGEDGQLALRSLASSTFSTLLPKIETRGQLGAARWRLVSDLEEGGGLAGGAGPTGRCKVATGE